MPHASSIQLHSESDNLVTVGFSVPSDEVTLGADEAFISTGADSAIRIPITLMTESDESGYVVFEVRIPSNVAAAVGNICAELFRLAYTNQAD
jgi:hypothetical protein